MFLFDRCNLGKFLHQLRESSTADVYLMWHRKLCIHYFGCSCTPRIHNSLKNTFHQILKYKNNQLSYKVFYWWNQAGYAPEVSYYCKCIRQRFKKYTIHLRNNFSCLFTNGGFNIVYKRMKTFKPSLLLTEFNQAEKEVSDSQVQYKKVEMEFSQDAETKNILYVWHFLHFKPHLLLWKNKTFL